MNLFQWFLFLFAAPLVASIEWQEYFHESVRAISDAYHTYLPGTEEPLPPRSEIPLLISTISHQSHFEKILAVAVALAESGYPVTFICFQEMEPLVANLHPNITFYPYQGPPHMLSKEDMAQWQSIPPGVDNEIFVSDKILLGNLPNAHNTLQTLFHEHRNKYGDDKPLISLFDQIVTGHQPIFLGVPGLKPDASISIGMSPLALDSVDTFPFRSGKKPHQGPEAKEVHRKAYESIKEDDRFTWELSHALWAKLKKMGSTREKFPMILDGMHRNADYLITLGIPEFEYPRSDIRPNVRYYGAIHPQKKKQNNTSKLPSWWDDVRKAKEDGKKIIIVSQGTVETDPRVMLLPTLHALKDRDDVLVIATFYLYEPEEVPDLVVPDNARVAKYIPHDELLPYVDVFVGNGGYGAVQKFLQRGIPMVLSGKSQDKAATCALADFTGVAIDLDAERPSSEKIGAAVARILEDDSYRVKAKEMSKAYERYDLKKEFDTLVQDIVKDWQKRRRTAAKEEL